MTNTAFAVLTEAAPDNTLTGTGSSRWLHVVSHTDPRYGGLSSAVPALVAGLDTASSLETALAAFCHPGEQHIPAELAEDKITFWPTSRMAWRRDGDLKANFADALRQADGLHIHGLWEESTATACRWARNLGKPYVISAHGMLEPWALAAKQLKKRIYAALVERGNVAGARCLHALTEAEATQYRNFGATCPIAVIPNSVHLPDGVSADLFLDRFPQLRGKRIVLFLSRLHAKKGLDLLLTAWKRVASRHPDARLVLAGPDADGMQARLLEQAQALGMAGDLLFTGMLAGAMKWSALCAAEAYVLPSYSEGLSMALLEAMGMGLPVIATRACNMPDITRAAAGWEIEPNADALMVALQTVLEHSPEENAACGRNGARLIAARYTPRQVTRQMAELYQFVLGGPQPSTLHAPREGAR